MAICRQGKDELRIENDFGGMSCKGKEVRAAFIDRFINEEKGSNCVNSNQIKEKLS
jgi:hypothetical protein